MSLPRLRPLLLPVEHGGWGFLCEPIVIGLVATPSVPGSLIAAGALGLFLARPPLKVAMDDWRHRRRVPRTRWAWGIAAGYLALATAALTGATMLAGPRFWMVGVVAAPLAVLALAFDVRGASRGLLPELAGATALGATAGATALVAGWTPVLALTLWASALVRVLPAIVTVRERVLRLHGEPPRTRGAAIAHVLALLASGGLAIVGLMPVTVVGVAALLAARALWDLRDGAPARTAMQIGLTELVIGLVAAAVIGGGWG